jgi:hypothetical protein
MTRHKALGPEFFRFRHDRRREWPHSCASQRYRRKWDQGFESGLLQRRVYKLSVPVAIEGDREVPVGLADIALKFELDTKRRCVASRQRTRRRAPSEPLHHLPTRGFRALAVKPDVFHAPAVVDAINQ